ncbi:MAG TPA: hypothetical protein VGG63_12295 [Steroidobacteraceae bacterium]
MKPMVRIRNCISGAVALAASLLLAMAPALGQDHGFHGAHGGGGHFAAHGFGSPHGRYAVPQHWAGMHPRWGGGPRVGGAWVRPWGAHWVPHTWGGGYWHGAFWPHVHLGWDFPWFLGVIPLGYTTYWWGGVPYYYGQGVYYAWNPDYDSYVVTDPPPVTGGVAQGAEPPPAGGQPGAAAGQGDMSLFVYPKNGQSDQQTANDRYQCHQWAVSQTGYDPTNTANSQQAATATPDSYKRAITACLDARGYSVK